VAGLVELYKILLICFSKGLVSFSFLQTMSLLLLYTGLELRASCSLGKHSTT
jgi:hypothetical protein